MSVKKRVHVIGCGVLAIDVRHTAERLGIETGETWLEAGLHDRPGELRRRLQAAIDAVSDAGGCDRIIVGYGICGRGTVGLHARSVPLVIPKAHDCIALFLGSDSAYKREFARFPGTYYVSAGWYEGKVQPLEARRQDGEEPQRGEGDISALAVKYGEDNAQAIVDFMNSWQRNYQRAAFVDTGCGSADRYASYAEAMAQEFGWRYECLPGDLSLVEAMLTAEESTDAVLVVSAGFTTTFDAIGSCLAAGPPVSPELHPASVSEEQAPSPTAARLGLGIDAGGTYTDVVIYDFTCDAVLGKAKALTTRWDYTVGICEALNALDADLVGAADLVALSTTLATNAIVEGQGQRVGLLVMPPEGLRDVRHFPHSPCAILQGRLDIAGHELEPLDLDEVRRAARQMVDASAVAAFAISGYAGAINPSHELAVKAAVRDETGLSVTCGHELSGLLNFRARADTAVLNARIIPRLDRLIADVRSALAEHCVTGRLMVVKGDGSLISARAAHERPVETVLSGPAASVAGARRLTGKTDAIVVDMGGTTTDTALIADGRVRTCTAGARVGGWQTHVQALDLRTAGLGGDSLIAWEGRELSVGPVRVAPVSWLGRQQPGTDEALRFLERYIEDFDSSTRPMELLALAGHTDDLALNAVEQRVVTLLAERPHSMAELAERANVMHWQLLRLERLEEHQIVQRCGLTPTDLLHVQGRFDRWDPEAAQRLCSLYQVTCG
ncbi:DUF1638 domain-containing protein, partial [bacterium]|nr:DUF1638 domain-containing protein [bacterium]